MSNGKILSEDFVKMNIDKTVMKENKLQIALLISGSGTTMEAIIKACQKGVLAGLVEPTVVVSSRQDNQGIKKAKKYGIKTFVVRPKDFLTSEAFGERLIEIFRDFDIDLVSQNGWLPLTPPNVVKRFSGKIINQHPGPLDGKRPGFGGKGMYGARVTCARLAFLRVTGQENPWTESTIHYVSERFDEGSLIRVVRLAVPLFPRPVTIAQLRKNSQKLIEMTKLIQKKLLPLEHRNVIAVLRAFAEGNPPHFIRSQPLIPSGQEWILLEAKKLARELFP